MKKILTFGLAASALLIGSTQAQAATFIDNFNNGTIRLDVDHDHTSASASAMADDSDVLGQEREASLTFSPPNPGQASVRVDLDMTANDFRHNNETQVASIATLLYDGINSDGLGGGAGINLLNLGSNLSVDIEAIDLRAELNIALMDFSGATSVLELSDLTVGTAAFNFANFSGVDLTKITSISLQSVSSNSEDLRLDSFRVDGITTPPPDTAATPEPAAVLGLLFSLGCGALSKKKKLA